MISTRALPTRRSTPQPRRKLATAQAFQDPADLSDALRALAVSAHRAVRASQALRSSAEPAAEKLAASRRVLSELHSRIVQLQRSVSSQALSGLTPYVEALRRKVLDESLVLGRSS
jgi:hypothetical protein